MQLEAITDLSDSSRSNYFERTPASQVYYRLLCFVLEILSASLPNFYGTFLSHGAKRRAATSSNYWLYAYHGMLYAYHGHGTAITAWVVGPSIKSLAASGALISLKPAPKAISLAAASYWQALLSFLPLLVASAYVSYMLNQIYITFRHG